MIMNLNPYGLSGMTVVGLLLAIAASKSWDFENDAEGKLPAGWSAAKTGEGPGSVWKIVATGMGRALAQASSEGPNSLFNLCIVEGAKYGDVDLSVRVKAISGEKDRGGGLVWHYRDKDNYYVCRWNPLENNFRVYHVIDGKRTQLADSNVAAAPDEWHTVRAVQQGNHIQCNLDGKLLLDVADGTLPDAGAVGVWCKSDAVSWFDDFQVQSLGKE
jgi:hypothetical protein